ncbi:MAG: hypothetical protein ABFC34_17645 [Methanobacterium sp.]
MAVKGTLEYYRGVYMVDGLDVMVQKIRETLNEAGVTITAKRLNQYIQGVFYGCSVDGAIRGKPPAPNPFDMTQNQDKYDFEENIYKRWISSNL